MLWMFLACGDAPKESTEPKSVDIVQSTEQKTTSPSQPPQNNNVNPGKGPSNGPNGPSGQLKGPPGPPMNGGKGNPGNVANGSGGAFQDPSGFPPFHDWPAPKGPEISEMGTWSTPVQLTQKPTGGYRPQIAVGTDDTLHVVYYHRKDEGDIIQHRMSNDGVKWSDSLTLGHDKDRNWGPDLVTRSDGSIVLVYDHALADFSSRGYLTYFNPNTQSWSEPEALTPADGGEIGSGHVADALDDQLAYVFIGKPLGEEYRFQAKWRWFKDGKWSETKAFSDGTMDAWHTNVERRPDGTVVAGFDIGTGGAATTLYFVEGSNGQFGTLENITSHGEPGERPHFAFSTDTDYVTWFHKEKGAPQHIYVRAHERSGKWHEVEEPSKGYGGFHFDPEIAINDDGVLCLIWGWDSGQDAEMVYSLNEGKGWSAPKKLADINWGKPGLASISVDSKGDFHVVWNQGVRGYNEIYYSRLEVQ